ncbi:MAG: FkbM family methyltransferase [Alphaproteobacteria bacterium]|nr:FkbM family methyltransferase [Alphaproteobacteria bacterium]
METQKDALARLLGDDSLKCVDVGARGGIQRHWLPFAGLVSVDAIEPDPAACAAQAGAGRPGEHWFPVGLGARTGPGTLYVLNKPSGSSLYPPDPGLMETYSGIGYGTLKTTIEVPLLTFSDFIRAHGRPLPNLVKLDTQGSELDILRALEPAHWADLLAIQTEAEIVPLYRGQPLLFDLHAFLTEKGFLLYDFLPVRHYRFKGDRDHYYLRKYLGIGRNRRDISARLVAGDAFYVRPPEEVLRRGRPAEVAKLLLIFLLYRFLDEALWLSEEAEEAGIFKAAEAAALRQTIRLLAPRPTLRQRTDWLGRLSRKLARRLGIGQARKPDYWLERKWDF